MGVEPPAPRSRLNLSEEGYIQEPLSVSDQNALNAKLTLLTSHEPDATSL